MQKKYLALALVAALVSAPVGVRAEGKDGIAAVVNGEKVTVKDIRQAYEANPQIKAQVSFEDFYARALDVFVNGKMLFQAAEGEKVAETSEFKGQLAVAKEELARKVYLEKKVNPKITDAAVKKLYKEYKDTFKSEKEMKAKHILVDSEAKANEVIAKLKKGESFDSLAKKYTKEPTELGYFTKAMMVPEFGNAAFALKAGQYSQKPVKSQYGYHVIYAEDLRDSSPLPMSQIEPQLKNMLTQQAVAEIFSSLNQNAKVTKYDLKGNVVKTDAPAAAN